MELKSKLFTIFVGLFFATELLNFLSVEGPYDLVLHLTFLEFIQPFFIFTLSLVTLALIFIAPSNFTKFLFIFVQVIMILTELFVMVVITVNSTSSIIDIFDKIGFLIFGLILSTRLYLIYSIKNLPVNAQA